MRWKVVLNCATRASRAGASVMSLFFGSDALEVTLDEEARAKRNIFLNHGFLSRRRHGVVEFLVAALRFRCVAGGRKKLGKRFAFAEPTLQRLIFTWRPTFARLFAKRSFGCASVLVAPGL